VTLTSHLAGSGHHDNTSIAAVVIRAFVTFFSTSARIYAVAIFGLGFPSRAGLRRSDANELEFQSFFGSRLSMSAPATLLTKERHLADCREETGLSKFSGIV
jgi:hypothetical protein